MLRYEASLFHAKIQIKACPSESCLVLERSSKGKAIILLNDWFHYFFLAVRNPPHTQKKLIEICLFVNYCKTIIPFSPVYDYKEQGLPSFYAILFILEMNSDINLLLLLLEINISSPFNLPS